jgi:integration host factor subunit alpha
MEQNLGQSTLTKADIVEKVYRKASMSKTEAADLVELVFSSLRTVLRTNGKVKVSGFGNFIVREKKERVGRNPQTGDRIKISGLTCSSFRCDRRRVGRHSGDFLKFVSRVSDFAWSSVLGRTHRWILCGGREIISAAKSIGPNSNCNRD